MNTFNRIRKIACNVRLWAEEMQEKDNCWDDDLNCMCGIASYELFKRLKRAGLKPTMCFADVGHAFIQCHGYTVDVTATQFQGEYYKDDEEHDWWKAVEIRPAKEAEGIAQFWESDLQADSEEMITAIFKDWPEYQVHPKLTKRIRRM